MLTKGKKMTIDEAIKFYSNKNVVFSEEEAEAQTIALNTMRKYQQIRKQIKFNLKGVEITLEVLVEDDPLMPVMKGAKDTLEDCLELFDRF